MSRREEKETRGFITMKAITLLALTFMGVGMVMDTVAGEDDLLPARRGGSGDRNTGEGVECVPCDVLFSQLQPNEWGGRDQDIEMQLRGEVRHAVLTCGRVVWPACSLHVLDITLFCGVPGIDYWFVSVIEHRPLLLASAVMCGKEDILSALETARERGHKYMGLECSIQRVCLDYYHDYGSPPRM